MVPLTLAQALTEPQTLAQAQARSLLEQPAGMVRQPWTTVQLSTEHPGSPLLQLAGVVPVGQLDSVVGLHDSAVLHWRKRQNSPVPHAVPLHSVESSSSLPSVLQARGATQMAKPRARAARLPKRTRAEEDMARLSSAVRCPMRCP